VTPQDLTGILRSPGHPSAGDALALLVALWSAVIGWAEANDRTDQALDDRDMVAWRAAVDARTKARTEILSVLNALAAHEIGTGPYR
jgi:hypothetical protein